MTHSEYKLISDDFSPVPTAHLAAPTISGVEAFSDDLDVIGITVGTDDDAQELVGIDAEALKRAGFEGKSGNVIRLVQAHGPELIVLGVGERDEVSDAVVRDVAATFARSAKSYAKLGIRVTGFDSLKADALGQALAEGVVLARYRYNPLKSDPKDVVLETIEILVDGVSASDVEEGARVGAVTARAASLARDLANTPPGHLTATDFADVAESIGAEAGLAITVFDKRQLIELGCGALLGVNAGSAEEPRMIQVRYAPENPTGHLALVGKGITYDSGGISLKPSNPMHVLMKMDMAGAGAAFAAMTVLKELDCPTAVTAYLMCTDNMPSGSAVKLGDVLTAHDGTTIEVKNTDAEGRLVMADALALASEESPDAIVDIATLTGAALAALGQSRAAMFGNTQSLVDQVRTAADATDEPVWQLPLERKYRKRLDSTIADISNMGGSYAGATMAALFLEGFVKNVPWAHLDIAGTMNVESDESWRSLGATGFGTRLLIELAQSFAPASSD